VRYNDDLHFILINNSPWIFLEKFHPANLMPIQQLQIRLDAFE